MSSELFLEVDQYGKISKAQADADEAKRLTKSVEARISDLERRMDRTTLACQALWELLRERSGLTHHDVFAKMEEIDLRDGRSDGRIGGMVMTCSKCGRNVNTRSPRCIYCGKNNASPHIVR